jgi:transcriptional regulator with XRE-family HTH domain
MEKRDAKYIGNLIRTARKTAGMSQMDLAEKIGVTYQQVQKYEYGKDEINVKRLFQFAKALNAPLDRLVLGGKKMAVSEPISSYGKLSKEENELVKSFRKIKSKKTKNTYLTAMKNIAGLLDKNPTNRKRKKTKS